MPEIEEEDKALFVQRINEALIECGAGRYDWLRETPMEYVREGASRVRHVLPPHGLRERRLPAGHDVRHPQPGSHLAHAPA